MKKILILFFYLVILNFSCLFPFFIKNNSMYDLCVYAGDLDGTSRCSEIYINRTARYFIHPGESIEIPEFLFREIQRVKKFTVIFLDARPTSLSDGQFYTLTHYETFTAPFDNVYRLY